MSSKRILGVDYGDARTGLAVSDPTGLLAGGIGVIQSGYDRGCAKEIVQAAEQYDVCRIVIGKPLNMNGTAGPRAQKVDALIEILREMTQLPIDTFDERLTTVAAHLYLSESNIKSKKRKKVVDALSAQIILQNYLDARKSRGE